MFPTTKLLIVMKNHIGYYGLKRPLCQQRLGTFLLTLLAVFCARSQDIYYNAIFDTDRLSETVQVADNGESYIRYYWEGLDLTTEVGQPELPVQYLNFLVPTYCKDFSVEAVSYGIQTRKQCGYLPYPCQPELYIDGRQMSAFVEFEDSVMMSDKSAPEVFVVDDGYIGGDNHIVTVGVCPVLYSGMENVVTVYNDIRIKLHYEECGEDELIDCPIPASSANPFFNLEKWVVNYDPNDMRARAQAAADNSLKYYYIVTPQSLKSSLADLITWKRQKGYEVRTVTIEEILANSKYKVGSTAALVDAAASLRAYLADQFRGVGSAFFCLLVGDWKTSMPMRKIRSSSLATGGENTSVYIPTDNYFSDLTTTWDLSKKEGETIYVGPYSVKYAPDIYVGRLLCHSATQVKNYLTKLFLYESNPGRGSRNYLGDALFFEQHQFTSKNWGYIPSPEKDWEASLIHASKPARVACSDLMNVILMQDRTYTEGRLGPTSVEVVDAMKDCGISNWYGHGSPYGVCVAMYNHIIPTKMDVLGKKPYHHVDPANQKALNQLNNINKPSIVYSISCENAPFECYEREDTVFSDLNLAQIFTVASSLVGGPAFLGNSREGRFLVNQSNSLNAGSSPKLNANFYEELAYDSHIGVAEAYSKIDLTSNYICATHNLIGEPEFQVWTSVPGDLDVKIEYGASNIVVTGKDLVDCRVIVYDGSRSVTYKGGTQSLMIPYSTNKINSYVVSVWKSGYLPIINMMASSGTLSDVDQSFVVREAVLGSPEGATSGFEVGDGANLRIRAIDLIECEDNFTVSRNGSVELESDNAINLSSAKVLEGGRMDVRAEQVEFSAGFSVEKGGELTIY